MRAATLVLQLLLSLVLVAVTAPAMSEVPQMATRGDIRRPMGHPWWPIKRSADTFAGLRLLRWFNLFRPCFHLLLFVAAPVGASRYACNAPGGEWSTNAGLGIRCDHQRRRYGEARCNREPEQGKRFPT